ncbi:hypothetical protein RF55_25337 [Lasius niger]|uniref:Endonuclease/exonuclease/phosphatase domain-containing protein n=1 Tax=Lasius niger TaxID=67767 RepID=A0A0J7JUJ3_LASNI|nr:hypothetical protein RF55_25337 [Lasius niger]
MDRLNIIAIYRRPTGTVQRHKWKEIFDIDTGQTESLYVGDFNAHNTTSNCVQIDTNSDRLWEVIYNKDLICLNEDTMSRLGEVGQRSSNLDLVFASVNIADRGECVELNDTWGSDYFPIELGPPHKLFRKLVRNLKFQSTHKKKS